jgi:dTMP kinase
MLVVLEGIDGTGKATQTKMLSEKLRAHGLIVNNLSFPRYGMGYGAEMVSRYLRGDCGELDPYAAAMFYAMDRFEHRADLMLKLETSDVVVVDRYVGSNLAHQSARVVGDSEKQTHLKRFITWLEYELYRMPVPDVQILLSSTTATAAKNREKREAADILERDSDHQSRALEQYQSIASELGWLTILTVHDGRQREPDAITQKMFEHVMRNRIYKTGLKNDVKLNELAKVIFGDVMASGSSQRVDLCVASAKRALDYILSTGKHEAKHSSPDR